MAAHQFKLKATLEIKLEDLARAEIDQASNVFFRLGSAHSTLDPAAAPVTVFSDLNGTATPGGYIVGQYSPGNAYVLGAAFIPSGQTYTLTQIQALLSFNSGINIMFVELHQDAGGVPGQTLESWILSGVLGPAPAIITMNSVLQPTLQAGQRYWVTVGMEDSKSTGVWWINNINLGGPCCGPYQVQGIATGSLNGEPFTPSAPTNVGFHAFGVFGFPQATTYVYVANRNSDNISAYVLNPANGILTPLFGSPFSSAVGSPNDLAVHPTGKFLYVAPFGGGSVRGFSIDSAGPLTPVPGSPFTTDAGSCSVAVDPTGCFAYVTNLSGNDVSGASPSIRTPESDADPWFTFSERLIAPWDSAVDPLGRFGKCSASCGGSGVAPGLDLAACLDMRSIPPRAL